jgi:hypothetical protein
MINVRRYEGLEYMESIIYFPYIPYLIDIVIFYIDGVLESNYGDLITIFDENLITIFVFTLHPINRDLCIVNN